MRLTLRTLVMSGALLASITGAQAKELIFGSWAIPNHGVNVYGLSRRCSRSSTRRPAAR